MMRGVGIFTATRTSLTSGPMCRARSSSFFSVSPSISQHLLYHQELLALRAVRRISSQPRLRRRLPASPAARHHFFATNLVWPCSMGSSSCSSQSTIYFNCRVHVPSSSSLSSFSPGTNPGNLILIVSVKSASHTQLPTNSAAWAASRSWRSSTVTRTVRFRSTISILIGFSPGCPGRRGSRAGGPGRTRWPRTQHRSVRSSRGQTRSCHSPGGCSEHLSQHQSVLRSGRGLILCNLADYPEADEREDEVQLLTQDIGGIEFIANQFHHPVCPSI